MPLLGFTNGGQVAAAAANAAATYVSVFNTTPGGIAAAVDGLRFDRLSLVARRLYPQLNNRVTNDLLTETLMAAEADLSQQLRVWFQPRTIIPISAAPSEAAALTAAGAIVEYEPGYDYDPDLFMGNTWGLFELRQKPVVSIGSIVFAYPSQTSTLYTIPPDWVRLEAKYGRFNLVPTNTTLQLPLNSYLLSTLGGGRIVPLMIQIRYVAGIANIQRDYPNIIDLIKRMAVLRLIDTLYLPQSSSASADGLSQSLSWESAKAHDEIKAQIERLRERIHGVNMMVV